MGFVYGFILLRKDCKPWELFKSLWNPTSSPDQMVLNDLIINLRRDLIHSRIRSWMIALIVFVHGRQLSSKLSIYLFFNANLWQFSYRIWLYTLILIYSLLLNNHSRLVRTIHIGTRSYCRILSLRQLQLSSTRSIEILPKRLLWSISVDLFRTCLSVQFWTFSFDA